MEKQGEVEAGKKGLEEGLVASANQKEEGGVKKIKALRKQKGVNDEESQVSGKNKSQGKKKVGEKSQQDGNQDVDQVEDLSKVKNKQEAEEESEIIMTFNMSEFQETPLTEGCKKIRELEMKAKQLEMKEKLLDIERKATDRQLEAEKEKLKAALLDKGSIKVVSWREAYVKLQLCAHFMKN